MSAKNGDTFKLSGKRVVLPEAGAWKFTPRPGGWVIAESPSGERRRVQIAEIRGKLSIAVGGTLYHGEIARAARASAGGGGGSDSDLVAQFPGKVRKILVAEGAAVPEGEPLVLVEAMKMEFAIKAPYAGTVSRVLVAEGQQLSPGDRFVEMAPLASGATDG